MADQRYRDRRDEAGRDFTQYVADQIKATIIAKGKSQRGVAKATGIKESTLRRRLASRLPFNTREIDKVAAYLDVSVEELLKSSAFIVVGDIEIEGDGNTVQVGTANALHPKAI